MVRLVRNCRSVGVSRRHRRRERITVARINAARKAGISRAVREIAKARTVFLRSIVIRITKPLMMKQLYPQVPGPEIEGQGDARRIEHVVVCP